MNNVAVNKLVEVFHKTLYSFLKKVVSKLKRDLHERIGEALLALIELELKLLLIHYCMEHKLYCL